jgi:hypothetical protein
LTGHTRGRQALESLPTSNSTVDQTAEDQPTTDSLFGRLIRWFDTAIRLRKIERKLAEIERKLAAAEKAIR